MLVSLGSLVLAAATKSCARERVSKAKKWLAPSGESTNVEVEIAPTPPEVAWTPHNLNCFEGHGASAPWPTVSGDSDIAQCKQHCVAEAGCTGVVWDGRASHTCYLRRDIVTSECTSSSDYITHVIAASPSSAAARPEFELVTLSLPGGAAFKLSSWWNADLHALDGEPIPDTATRADTAGRAVTSATWEVLATATPGIIFETSAELPDELASSITVGCKDAEPALSKILGTFHEGCDAELGGVAFRIKNAWSAGHGPLEAKGAKGFYAEMAVQRWREVGGSRGPDHVTHRLRDERMNYTQKPLAWLLAPWTRGLPCGHLASSLAHSTRT